MPRDKLNYLGNCIRQARNDCNLTQQDLADQSLNFLTFLTLNAIYGHHLSSSGSS